MHTLSAEALQITFGDRVRRLRTALHLAQDEFGAAIDYSGAAVGRWETMDHTPRSSKRVIAAVELRFGARAAAFLRGDVPQSTDYRTLLGARSCHLGVAA